MGAVVVCAGGRGVVRAVVRDVSRLWLRAFQKFPRAAFVVLKRSTHLVAWQVEDDVRHHDRVDGLLSSIRTLRRVWVIVAIISPIHTCFCFVFNVQLIDSGLFCSKAKYPMTF